jgi:hypothetical protein
MILKTMNFGKPIAGAKGLRCNTTSECSVIEEDFKVGTANKE